jgi:hypothetical protein
MLPNEYFLLTLTFNNSITNPSAEGVVGLGESGTIFNFYLHYLIHDNLFIIPSGHLSIKTKKW